MSTATVCTLLAALLSAMAMSGPSKRVGQHVAQPPAAAREQATFACTSALARAKNTRGLPASEAVARSKTMLRACRPQMRLSPR